MMTPWARQAWTSKSREFLRRSLLPQSELTEFLQRRAWLEGILDGFDVSKTIDPSSHTAMPAAKIPPRVLLYGSSIAGTAFANGDADFAVVFPSAVPLNKGEFVSPPDEKDAPPLQHIPLSAIGRVGGCNVFARPVQPTVLNALHHHMQQATIAPPPVASSSSGKTTTSASTPPHLQRIFRARIPIMQYVPSLDDLKRRQRHPGLPADLKNASSDNKREHYDISLSVDGARNSILVRSYMKAYPKLRVLVLLLKHWGRQQKILNARRGWISPYALTIMAIHFAKETALIPELIAPASSDAVLEKVAAQMNVTMEGNAKDAGLYGVEELDTVLPFDVEAEAEAFDGVADYLRAFFEFYGNDNSVFDLDTHVIDIRTEDRVNLKANWFSEAEKATLSEAEQWHRVGYGVLMIRDPYEMHSLGRSVEFFRSEAIRDAMRRAAVDLSSPDALFGDK